MSRAEQRDELQVALGRVTRWLADLTDRASALQLYDVETKLLNAALELGNAREALSDGRRRITGLPGSAPAAPQGENLPF